MTTKYSYDWNSIYRCLISLIPFRKTIKKTHTHTHLNLKIIWWSHSSRNGIMFHCIRIWLAKLFSTDIVMTSKFRLVNFNFLFPNNQTFLHVIKYIQTHKNTHIIWKYNTMTATIIRANLVLFYCHLFRRSFTIVDSLARKLRSGSVLYYNDLMSKKREP